MHAPVGGHAQYDEEDGNLQDQETMIVGATVRTSHFRCLIDAYPKAPLSKKARERLNF